MSLGRQQPFDAVLFISFGGPQGLHEIRPFLANVLRGRRVPPERIEEVAHHYEMFDGVSPITELTRRQAEALSQRLQQEGPNLPVFVGMRNWHPFLADTLVEMSARGVRRAIGFIAAAHKSYSSCGQYKQNVLDARRELRERTGADIEIAYVDDWFDNPRFIEAVADRVAASLRMLEATPQKNARLIFTAHSLPKRMARECRYEQQLLTSCRLVADALARTDWRLVYQSRSGRPEDPWLGPDVCDYLRAERSSLSSAVTVPIGFICDHVEVLYDLDHEAADLCRDLDLPMVRAETVNDHPKFAEMMADVVRRTWNRHRTDQPLSIVSDVTPTITEGPPPNR